VVGTLQIETSSDVIEQIEIHSFTGELIFTSKFEHKIDVSTLAPGSYLLIAMTKNNQLVSSEKFIKH
ncbi:MAG: T9SS type A sorting domain-containing protein, partial [Flavobacteriales bacterium]